MAACGRVQDNEVEASGRDDLLDLAEDEDVLDAGRRGGDHVQRARGHEPTGETFHPVVAQVLDQGIVRSEPPTVDGAPVGLSIIGGRGTDLTLMAVARAFEEK